MLRGAMIEYFKRTWLGKILWLMFLWEKNERDGEITFGNFVNGYGKF